MLLQRLLLCQPDFHTYATYQRQNIPDQAANCQLCIPRVRHVVAISSPIKSTARGSRPLCSFRVRPISEENINAQQHSDDPSLASLMVFRARLVFNNRNLQSHTVYRGRWWQRSGVQHQSSPRPYPRPQRLSYLR